MEKNKVYFFLLFIIVVLVLIGGDLGYLTTNCLTPFKMMGWTASYSTGFVFRGMCGTLLTLIQRPASPQLIMMVNIIVMAICILLIYLYSITFYKKDQQEASLLMLIFFLVQPSVLQRWLTSAVIGRLDALLVLLFLVTLWLITAKNAHVKYIGTLLLSVFALLCHEGYAVLFVPTLFGMLLLLDQKAWRPICLYLIPMITAWIFVTILGQADASIESFAAMLQSNNTCIQVPLEKIKMVYYMDVYDKVKFTFNYYSNHTKQKIFKLCLTFIVMLPTIIGLYYYWRGVLKKCSGRKRLTTIILLVLTLSPLGAMIFGIDTYRWIGWALFNNVIALGTLFVLDEPCREVMIQTTKKKKLLIVAAIITALLLGFFTVFSSYDFVESLFKLIC